jgi:hypothetical protein
MRPYIYYIPLVVFMLVALGSRSSIDLMDPRVVKRPGGLWTPFRVFRDDEWTADGLVARRRLLRSMALAIALSILAEIVVLAIAGRA